MGSPWAMWVAAGLVFVGVLGFALLMMSSAFTPAARRRLASLDDYVGTAAGGARRAAESASPSALGEQVLQLAGRLTSGREGTARAALLLERADLPLRVNEWYVLRAVAVVVSLCLALVLFGGSVVGDLLGILFGGLLGYVVPALFLRIVSGRRGRRFETQLPDTLTLVASSLATGFSLHQALDAIVTDAPEPTSKEFSRALAETRIGADLEDALDRMAHRMASTNMEWATMAIRIQRAVGGNLAETLRTTAGTLRERESLYRHVRGLSAEGRLSAYILIALPVGVFLYMLKVNHPYVALLWQQPLGWVMSGMGLVSLTIGVFWMRRVVEVKV